MIFGRKPVRPVDRALADLQERIDATEREIRRVQLQPPKPAPPAPLSVRARPAPLRQQAAAAFESPAGFLRRMLVPGSPAAAPVTRARRDLFDIHTDPLKELDDGRETGPHAANALVGRGHGFDGAATMHAGAAAGPEAGRASVTDTRLVRYLSAGSLRGPKPLKHVQRKERNQFMMWLGLAFGVLWILYVVVR